MERRFFQFHSGIFCCSRLHRGKSEIIVQRAIVQAALDDLSAQRVEIVREILLDLIFEEVGQNFRARVVARFSELRLRLGAKEGLADILPIELHVN